MAPEIGLLAGFGVAAGGMMLLWLRRRRRMRLAAATLAWRQALKAERLRLSLEAVGGKLPALNAYDNDYRAQRGEHLLAWQEPVDRLEPAQGKAMPWGAGTTGCQVVPERLADRKGLVQQSHGRLLLTDRAVVYENQLRDERLGWSQIAGAGLMPDGYVLILRSGPAQVYQADSADPRFAAVLDYMLSRRA